MDEIVGQAARLSSHHSGDAPALLVHLVLTAKFDDACPWHALLLSPARVPDSQYESG